MKLNKRVVFFIGIVAGIASSTIGNDILRALVPNWHIKKPTRIGNIAFGFEKNIDIIDQEGKKIHQMFGVTKNNQPFFGVALDPNDQALYAYLFGGNKRVQFIMTSTEGGGWRRAIYGGEIGEMFVDKDFDGQFDRRLVHDDKGKVISIYGYINGEWIGWVGNKHSDANIVPDNNDLKEGVKDYFQKLPQF